MRTDINELLSTMQADADAEAFETTTHGQADFVALDEAHADQIAIAVEGLTGFSSGGLNEGPWETL